MIKSFKGLRSKNVKMRYRKELDPVLNGINLNIAPGEHVAILGRTGSGKSSMSLSLFRMYNLEKGSEI